MRVLVPGVCLTVLASAFIGIPIYLNYSRPNKSDKPNIIIILADDVGYNDFSMHGSNQIPTPNIDALGYHGQILHKFYAQSICTPSRTALLTGNYPIRSGMQGSPLAAGENRSLPLDMPIMSEYLKKLGYKTHLVGKWHLGAAYRNVTPTKRGFDTHFGYWNGFIGYFDHNAYQELPNGKNFTGYDFVDGFTPQYKMKGKYATEIFTERALNIIDNHNAKDPLFLYLAHLAGHTGSSGTELGVPNITETNKKYAYIADEKRRRFADLVNLMDKSVGSVVSKLAERDMLKNSIIIFMSDNGAPTDGMYSNAGSNWPFRGIKQTEFEGGVRVAATVFSTLFKKQIVNNNLMHITDWLPTLYAAAGGNIADLGQIDGVDQLKTLRENVTTKRREILLNINEKLFNSVLIRDKYKIVNASYVGLDENFVGEDGRGPEVPPYDFNSIKQSEVSKAITSLDESYQLEENTAMKIRDEIDMSSCRSQKTVVSCKPTACLFDLEEDPCETTNIYENNPDIAKNLLARLQIYYNELIPQTNKPVDPNANPKYYNNTWCTWLDTEFCHKTQLLSK